ncbi:hypothetical protein [Streptomyces sp. NPDC050988]|uniref:hypothetical protein n=1 Tax=Streptomyces sp. NPDC050988 TaxID=3365637 RepID=UPI0037A47C75
MTGVYCFEFEECGVPLFQPSQTELELTSSANSGAVPGGWIGSIGAIGRTRGLIGPTS